MRQLVVCATALLWSAAAIAAEPVAKVQVTSDTAALYVNDRAWSAAVKDKNVADTVELFTADATVLPPGQPMIAGTDALRKFYTEAFKDKAFAVSREPTTVELDGNLAYTIGNYTKWSTGAGGKPLTEMGKYVLVWKKQKDGSWKISADIWNAGAK